jgi:hypothetical protein
MNENRWLEILIIMEILIYLKKMGCLPVERKKRPLPDDYRYEFSKRNEE